MGLSYKYTENDQVQVQAFFKYTVVQYKYMYIRHVLGYNYHVHFRNYRWIKYMHNKINETKSTEFNSIVFGTLYLVYFCSLTNLLKQLI